MRALGCDIPSCNQGRVSAEAFPPTRGITANAENVDASKGLEMQDWYLVRTKPGCERVAQTYLQTIVDRTLLPLGKTQLRQGNRIFHRISPIFPCYLFASFSLAISSRLIRYTPGVHEIVRFGERAAVVPTAVINELMARCASGPAELARPTFSSGSPVQVVSGPFRELRAVFDCCLPGTDRVAVLLSLLNAERRVVLPARMVIAAECSHAFAGSD